MSSWKALALIVLSTSAQADPLEGLYRPAAPWAADWSCSPDYLGQDGGAVGLIDGTLYRVESQCSLGQARLAPNGPGRLYHATCTGEGETTATDIIITPTAVGIDITRDGQVMQWRRCDQRGAAQSRPTNSPWVLGYGMGVSEAWTADRDGNRIVFTCEGGFDGGITVELAGRPVPGGPVTFDVDGKTFPMTAWAKGGEIITDCNACADTYTALRDAVARGKVLTVRSGDAMASFGLAGSGRALAEPCAPAGSG